MKQDRERARRVLDLVRRLPDGVLDAALGAITVGPHARLLASVRAALQAPDPEAALADALHDIPEIDTADANMPSMDEGKRIAAAVDPIRAVLGELSAGRKALAELGDTVLLDALAMDTRLVPLLEDAVALLGDDGPFSALRSAVHALDQMTSIFAAIERGDASVSARLGALRADRDAISRAMAQLADVPALVAQALEHARIVGDRAAVARLAIASAALRGDLASWREALEHALDAQLLPEVQRAASAIEAAAIESGELDELAGVAARVAELAVELGDRDVTLSALGNRALALAQLGRTDDASAELERALAIAKGNGAREVRAQLLAGQVSERLGDASAARIAFRKVTERAQSVGLEHELGWAALHLGRLEAKAGQMFRAGQDLGLANDVARAYGDQSLLALAAAARIENAPDRTAAEAALVQAGGVGAAILAELQRRLDARWPV
jgi:tetratricopeptide (TPR) repeat protein